MTIGEKIKFLRKEKGMTQKQLADASGVCSRLIQRYEYGDGIPNTDTLLKISSGIGIDINEFSECSGKLPYSISHENQYNSMSIGERIKILRKENGMTQKRLSELTDIPVRTIQQYEAGTFKPKQGNLEKLAEVFEISVQSFYIDCVSEIKSGTNNTESELLSLFNSLDLTGKSKLLEYAELLQLKYRKETE